MKKIFYFYRIFAKLFSFFVFGFGTVLLFLLIFPFVRLFSRSKIRFQMRSRKILHHGSAFAVKFICLIGLFKIEISPGDKKILREAKSSILVANHPAFVDSFLLISLLPCTDFVAKDALSSKNFLSPVVNTFFMTNSMPLEKMIERTRENFSLGGTLALFPEGTRSPENALNPFKKGAARISLATGAPVVPVVLGGNGRCGMRKGDKFWQVNPDSRYIYEISVGKPIFPQGFSFLPPAIAAKRMTEKIRSAF